MMRPWQKAKFAPAASSSPPAFKVVLILSLVLPPVLYLISFALTVAAINEPDYVKAQRLSVGDPITSGEPTGQYHHASLFFDCVLVAVDNKNNDDNDNGDDDDDDDDDNGDEVFEETCSRRRPALGSGGLESCVASGVLDVLNNLCSKIVAAAELYVASAVLIGCAFLFASMHALLVATSPNGMGGPISAGAGANYHHHHHHHHHHDAVPAAAQDGGVERTAATKADAAETTSGEESVSARRGGKAGPTMRDIAARVLGALAIIFAVMGAGCLVMGQVLGVNALVDEASPSTSSPIFGLSRWTLSRGAKDLTSSAYAIGFIGSLVALTGCGTR